MKLHQLQKHVHHARAIILKDAAVAARRKMPRLRGRKAEMCRIIVVVSLLLIQATYARGQIRLSPINTGDCVSDRIQARRTAYVYELAKKYCAEHNPDQAKEMKCVENSKLSDDFSFFTDRCSDEEYFIGIEGKEVRLRKISKKLRNAHYFIGSFAGEGFRVDVRYPGRTKRTYDPYITDDRDKLPNGSFNVNVTVRKGGQTKTFKGVLLWGF